MPRFGTHGRVLIADLTTRTTRIEEIDESVYRQFLGGYGLGAWLMWKHFPAGTDALAPEACFAIVLGPAHRRAHAVLGAHPDRRQVAAHRTRGPTRTRAAACASHLRARRLRRAAS